MNVFRLSGLLLGVMALAMGCVSDADAFLRKRAVVQQRAVVVRQCVQVQKVVAVRQVAVAPVVVQAAIVTPVIARYVDVPLYGVGYSQQPCNTGSMSQAGNCGQLEVQLLQLRLELERLKVQQLQRAPQNSNLQPEKLQGPPGNQVQVQSLTVLKNKCAACHDAGLAKAKGNGLALLDGDNPLPITVAQQLSFAKHIYKGTMPKAGSPKCTDEEVGLLMAYLDTMK